MIKRAITIQEWSTYLGLSDNIGFQTNRNHVGPRTSSRYTAYNRHVLWTSGKPSASEILDADSDQRGPCVVDVTNKFTQTAEVLWRKRDGMATL